MCAAWQITIFLSCGVSTAVLFHDLLDVKGVNLDLDLDVGVDVDDSLANLKTYTLSGSMETSDGSLTSETKYGSNDPNVEDLWPEKWEDATAHGRWIAHRLDNRTLDKFLYAEPGTYEAEIPPLPQYSVPGLKMVSAVPGYRPKSPEQSKRVTVFPTYLALASTWDPYLVGEVARTVSEEFQTLGANVMLGPAINVHRTTQHSETFDSLSGEDPTLGSVLVRSWCLNVHHAGIMTVPRFLGRAEQDPRHFGNMSANATVWEFFYPPFQAAVDSGAAGVMCDAHEVDGVWACRDSVVLKRDLKEIMGFQGMVLSGRKAAMNYFPAPQDNSFERGLDVVNSEPVKVAHTEKGSRAMQKAATRVLAAIYHMKIDEHAGCDLPCTKQNGNNARSAHHSEVAKRVAASSVILFQNDGDLLPLTRDKVQTVALLGPAADALPDIQTDAQGDYFTGYHEGHIANATMLSPSYGLWSRGKDKGIVVTQNVTGADACIVVGGSRLHVDHWRLDQESLDAIDEAVARCPKVIVLMDLLGAVLTPWRIKVSSIMGLFHAGEETAFAWAATVFGDASPSGKTPLSFPMVGEDTVEYWKEPYPSYMTPSFQAAFPFGHGLSYASFIYQDMRQKARCNYPLCVVLTVLNSHPTVSGSEVVQVYFKFSTAGYQVPVLRGFYKTKVLRPGETDKAFFAFNHRDISTYHDVAGETQTEVSWTPQDEIEVIFGSSSSDIRGRLNVITKHA